MLPHPLKIANDYQPYDGDTPIWCPLQNEMVLQRNITQDDIKTNKKYTNGAGYKRYDFKIDDFEVKEPDVNKKYFSNLKRKDRAIYNAYILKANALKSDKIEVGYEWYREDMKRVYFELLENLVILSIDKKKTHKEIGALLGVSHHLVSDFFSKVSKRDFVVPYSYNRYIKLQEYTRALKAYLGILK